MDTGLTLKVGWADVKVRPSDPEGFEAETRYGYYSPARLTIYIDEAEPAVRQARTLVHEALHACFDVYRLGGAEMDEEAVCEALDGPLTTLIRDNPWVGAVLHRAEQGRGVFWKEPEMDMVTAQRQSFQSYGRDAPRSGPPTPRTHLPC